MASEWESRGNLDFPFQLPLFIRQGLIDSKMAPLSVLSILIVFLQAAPAFSVTFIDVNTWVSRVWNDIWNQIILTAAEGQVAGVRPDDNQYPMEKPGATLELHGKYGPVDTATRPSNHYEASHALSNHIQDLKRQNSKAGQIAENIAKGAGLLLKPPKDGKPTTRASVILDK